MDELTSYFFENYVVHGYGPADFRGMKADKIMAQIMELNPNEDREKAEAVGRAVARFVNPPGRPFLPPAERRQRVGVRLPPAMVEWLKKRGVTQTLEKLIETAMKNTPE